MDQINVAGEKILNVMMDVGYWTTLIAGSGNVINCIAKKDVQAALKKALTYGTAFGSLYMLRWLLDLIRGVLA